MCIRDRYGNALEAMSNEAVEYVRGIPVVKTFGQSVFSFKKFKAAIDEYEKWVVSYTKDLRLPMMFYTAAVNGVFAFLIAGGLLFTTHGVTPEFLLNLLFYICLLYTSLGLTTHEKIKRNSLIFKAVCIPGYIAYVLVCVYGINGAKGFVQGFWQLLVILLSLIHISWNEKKPFAVRTE